jgi:hypothetical protein
MSATYFGLQSKLHISYYSFYYISVSLLASYYNENINPKSRGFNNANLKQMASRHSLHFAFLISFLSRSHAAEFQPEDRGSMCLRSVCIYLQVHTMLQKHQYRLKFGVVCKLR